jgi:starch synthase
VEQVRTERGNIVWIEEMLDRWEMIQLLTHADVFCCPSVYEPLGLVNLEAMACETAVVASAVGGIPEVVEDGVTGVLVPFEPRADGEAGPADRARYATDLAAAITDLLGDDTRREAMGRAGRERVTDHFSWSTIAHEVLDVYGGALTVGG